MLYLIHLTGCSYYAFSDYNVGIRYQNWIGFHRLLSFFPSSLIALVLLQVNLCQKLFFSQNMLCSKIDLNFCTQHVLPRFELVIFMYWTCNSMNNLFSYCGFVDAKIRASDKDLPVSVDCFKICQINQWRTRLKNLSNCFILHWPKNLAIKARLHKVKIHIVAWEPLAWGISSRGCQRCNFVLQSALNYLNLEWQLVEHVG